MGETDRPLLVMNNRCIAVKNTSGQSAAVFCAYLGNAVMSISVLCGYSCT